MKVTFKNRSEVWFTLYGGIENVKEKSVNFKLGVWSACLNKNKLLKRVRNQLDTKMARGESMYAEIHSAYGIKGLLDKPIQRTFYLQELQKVQLKEKYTIEQILGKRMCKRRLEYKVIFRLPPQSVNLI